MKSKILAIKETINMEFWFNRFAWAMLIFGFVDLVIFKRVWIGWTIIIGSLIFMLSLHMKKHKWGIFNPEPKAPPETIKRPITKDSESNYRIPIQMLLTVVLLLIIGSLMFINGFKLKHWSDITRDSECYHCNNCTVFSCPTDCNITKLNEQEYGPNNLCNDMGTTEMAWKIGMMIIFLGIFLPGFYIFMILRELWFKPKK